MLFILPFVHGIVEVSSTSNQSAYSVILGLGHIVLYTDLVVQKDNAVSLVDFFFFLILME